ncbi:MAG: FtsH protease activity modulator HflK [Alphaproteobacteria bacterium]|nr:FtsH protease activity modulator HflK [Alphaproteobacteria bacterium]
MPWSNQSGGGRPGGSNRGPWGNGPTGGGPRPDLEDLLRRGQERLRRVLPRNFRGGGAIVGAAIVVAVWLASGIYVVDPEEQGVVLRFGAYIGKTTPGINYHFPWPIETVETPKVTRENQLNIGYRIGSAEGTRDVPEESLMLTGDENIVDINFTVFWVINDAAQFLFNVQNPDGQQDGTIRAVAESAMREVVGKNKIEPILTADREPIQDGVRDLMQRILNSYGAGVTVTRVQMLKADPPAQVIEAYRDVQAAITDQDRMRNEAEAYANKVVPEARGQAARVVQQAEGYKQQVIAEAQGEAARFTSVYEQYKKAPEVTRRRIYLDTMRDILAGTNKVILDSKNSSSVLPYLPLPELKQNPATAPRTANGPVADAGGAAR